MLDYAWIFLVIAIAAAAFGFGGITLAAAGVAKAFFYVFLGIFFISMHLDRRSV